MRGELSLTACAPASPSGSTPLARGTLHSRSDFRAFFRFNPACAGNSPKAFSEVFVQAGSTPLARGTHRFAPFSGWCVTVQPRLRGELQNATKVRQNDDTVQPRLRGELSTSIVFQRGRPGSTPLARGTHFSSHVAYYGGRFNPACAGNSVIQIVAIFIPPVQPRLRGELQGAEKKRPPTTRFNPACAGNSEASNCDSSGVAVQPRLRGELT